VSPLLFALVAWATQVVGVAQSVAVAGTASIASADAASAVAAPARIVSLAPSVTETLFALGVGSRVVAVSDYCDYPPDVRRLPKIGSFLDPNIEAIVGQRPDVVIGVPSPGNQAAVAVLRNLGIRVEVSDPEHLADLAPVTRMIAAAAGVPEAGERLIAEIDRGMDAVRARVATLPPRRVLMAIGQDPLVAVGATSFLGELIVAARGINVAPPGNPWPHVNVEYVIARDPEVIIDSSMGTEEGSSAARYWERLPSLAAVRERRVYAFRDYRALRPGPRLPAAFEGLARLIHPEAWQ
jgi:iron complex transport system substrate-binding protein